MFSFFTELNRKRPPAQLLDFVHNSTCPIVHAADDRSVMETHEALPYQVATARSYHRQDPLPHRAQRDRLPRQPSRQDLHTQPRQRAHLPGEDGSAPARAVRRRLDAGLHCELRSHGCRSHQHRRANRAAGHHPRKADYQQPYYDQLSGPAVYPAFHVVAGLTRAAGLKLVSATSSDDATVRCLAYKVKGADPAVARQPHRTRPDRRACPRRRRDVRRHARRNHLREGHHRSGRLSGAAARHSPAPKLTLKAYAVGIVCINDK